MKRRCIYIIIFFLAMSIPSYCFAWTKKVTEQIILDASSFAPYRFAKIVKQQQKNLKGLIDRAYDSGTPDKVSEKLFKEAISKTGNVHRDPQGALVAMIQALHPIIQSSSPTQSPKLLALIEKSGSCQQARFDGIQYVSSTYKRILISHQATEPARKIFKNWDSDKGDVNAASRAIATAYHLAVNDTADMMATLWKRTTGDSAGPFISPKPIYHRGSAESEFSLQAGYNPIPELDEYYRKLRTAGSRTGTRVRTSKPASKGVRLLELDGLRIINRDKKKPAKESKKPTRETPKDKKKAKQVENKKRVPVKEKSPEIKKEPKHVERKVEHKPIASPEKKTNGLTQQAVERVIQGLLPTLGACYQDIGAGKNGGGIVTVMFTINVDGSVSNVNVVGNTTGLPALSYCVETTIQKAKFPKSKSDPIRIRYPFVFD